MPRTIISYKALLEDLEQKLQRLSGFEQSVKDFYIPGSESVGRTATESESNGALRSACIAETIIGRINVHDPVAAIKQKQQVRERIRRGIAGTKKQIAEYKKHLHAEQIGEKTVEKQRRRAVETNKKRAAKRPDYAEAVERLMRDEDMDYHPACELAARQFDCSKQTVLNHTKHLRPGRNSKNA